jgi:LCP family protein required for cell wall assembly
LRVAHVKTLLLFGWAVFVVGGLTAGVVGVRNLGAPMEPRPNAPVAEPTSTALPAASSVRSSLRDFDQNPPPFAPAGQTDPQPTPAPSSSSPRMTTLLMGIDQRPDEAGPGGDPGRTDTMLLVSIDYRAHMTSMVSIPRDSFVVIPEHGNERVNAAYTFAELDQHGSGPDLAKRTVAQLFGVPVDHYVLVDIHSMEQIIDTLGGVWIDNPHRLVDTAYPTDDYRTITIDIPAGHLLLDGVTAVEYARTRHPDSDYGRQGRQQQVLLAIRQRALQLDVVPRLPQLVPEVLQLVHTDLNPLEIAQLVSFGRDISAQNIVTLPPDPSLTPSYVGPGGASYIHLLPAYVAAVRALVLEPRAAAERAVIAVYNAGAPVGSGARAAELLRQNGLSVGQIATAPRVASTRIETGSGARQSAELIARILSVSPDALVVSDDSSDVRVLLGPETP